METKLCWVLNKISELKRFSNSISKIIGSSQIFHKELSKFFVLVKRHTFRISFLTHLCSCLRALRAYAPYVPTCLKLLRAYVPTCLKLLRAYVPAYLHFSRAYVLTCVYIFFMPTCLCPLNYFVPTCAHFSRAYVPTNTQKYIEVHFYT